MLLKVVLNTNALLRCISRKSKYSIVLEKLESQQFELYISTPILFEYEEKISSIFSKENVHYVVTDDKHFNALSIIDFPKINVLTLADFTKLLEDL